MGGGLGGIPPACISKGFPATTGAPCTLVMGGLAEAAATPPGPVAAAEMVAGLADEPLVSLCIAYLGFLARCSSREISSGGCMILVVADVVAMRTGFLSSPYAGNVGLEEDPAAEGNIGLTGWPLGPVGWPL